MPLEPTLPELQRSCWAPRQVPRHAASLTVLAGELHCYKEVALHSPEKPGSVRAAVRCHLADLLLAAHESRLWLAYAPAPGSTGPVEAYGATQAIAGFVPGPNQIITCLLSGAMPSGGVAGGSVGGTKNTRALKPGPGLGGCPPPGPGVAQGGE